MKARHLEWIPLPRVLVPLHGFNAVSWATRCYPRLQPSRTYVRNGQLQADVVAKFGLLHVDTNCGQLNSWGLQRAKVERIALSSRMCR